MIRGIDPLLVRHLSGRADPDDADRLRRWRARHPGREAEFERVRTIWEIARTPRYVPDTEAALAVLKTRDSFRERSASGWRRAASVAPFTLPRSPRPARLRPAHLRTALLVAATLAALLLGGAPIWQRIVTSVVAPHGPSLRAFATEPGEVRTLRLRDGSRVVLNASSRVELADDFGRRERTVVLDGEAYFEVASRSDSPFLVRAHGAVAEVVGTRFGMRARSPSRMQVVVTEGRVSFGREGAQTRGAILERGDLGRIEAGGEVRVERGVPLEEMLDWVEGLLRFENRPLPEVLQALSLWYGREFVATDASWSELRITLSLDRASLPAAVEVLEAALDATGEVSDSAVVLRRGLP